MIRPDQHEASLAVELGQLPGARPDGRGRLYWWAEVGIIAPQSRTADRAWRCELVATDRSWQRWTADRPQVTDAELASLATTISASPADAEPFAMLWQTRVRQRWCGGRTPAVARVIAEGLRIPGTLTVDLDLSAISHIIRQTHGRPEGLRRILGRLAGGGYLSHTESTVDGVLADGQTAAVALTLPRWPS